MSVQALKELLQTAELRQFGDCLSDELLNDVLLNAGFELPKRKLKIKNKNKPIIDQDMIDCQKFIDKCKKKKLKIYKYTASLFWTGPAIVITNESSTTVSKLLVSMRKLFRGIPINIDQDNNKIVIYPQCKSPKSDVDYDFSYNEETQEINVSFWEYGKQVYIIDTNTNEVFDSSSHEKLGYRELNSDGDYTIEFD